MTLYAQRNSRSLEPHLSRHMLAMTDEELHNKGDIACELAWRDAEIERLQDSHLHNENLMLIRERTRLLSEIERLTADLNQGAKDYCALMERHDEQRVEIERLNNKLNQDSQQFQILCQETEIERLREELRRTRALVEFEPDLEAALAAKEDV